MLCRYRAAYTEGFKEAEAWLAVGLRVWRAPAQKLARKYQDSRGGTSKAEWAGGAQPEGKGGPRQVIFSASFSAWLKMIDHFIRLKV